MKNLNRPSNTSVAKSKPQIQDQGYAGTSKQFYQQESQRENDSLYNGYSPYVARDSRDSGDYDGQEEEDCPETPMHPQYPLVKKDLYYANSFGNEYLPQDPVSLRTADCFFGIDANNHMVEGSSPLRATKFKTFDEAQQPNTIFYRNMGERD